MSKSCEAPPASFTSALNGTAPAKLAMKSGVSQPFTMRSRPAASAPRSAGADVVVRLEVRTTTRAAAAPTTPSKIGQRRANQDVLGVPPIRP